MAMSPLGNIIHVNQNMQVQTLLQANHQHRVDMQTLVNMQQFNDKLKEIEEVRPAEESANVDEDGQNRRDAHFQEQEETKKEETEEQKEEEHTSTIHHLLDIKV